MFLGPIRLPPCIDRGKYRYLAALFRHTGYLHGIAISADTLCRRMPVSEALKSIVGSHDVGRNLYRDVVPVPIVPRRSLFQG